MEELSNTLQGSNIWKRDITLLCCVLRLRCQPAVPYEAIADVILCLLPDVVDRLAKRVWVHGGLGSFKSGMRQWFTEYLQQSFEYAEHWSTELWIATQGWSTDVVGEVLRITELNRLGYGVMDDAEVRLQIKWRKEGSWKAGSTPLGGPRSVDTLRAARIRSPFAIEHES
jgi:hypothetical protein